MNKTTIFRMAFTWLPRMPRGLLRGVAELAALGTWALVPAMRHRVRANLRHIPTLAANPIALERATRRAFRSLMLNYLNLFVPPPPGVAARFPIRNVGALRAVQAAGRGCIFLSVHSAGFEWGRHALPLLLRTPVMGPMETVQPPELYDLMARERGKSGTRFLPITEGATLREMIAALRRNETVLLALDRDVLHSGLVMPFFGAPARIPTGAIALARLTGAPIVLGMLWRGGTVGLEGVITTFPLDLVGPETRGDEAVRRALTTLVAAMEREIMQRPDQWLAAFTDDVWLAPAQMAEGATTSARATENSHASAG